jgi:hypothetical protein
VYTATIELGKKPKRDLFPLGVKVGKSGLSRRALLKGMAAAAAAPG